MDFVTVESVDAALGAEWATAEQKPQAVIEANIWLTARVKPVEPAPDAVTYAGALLAKEAATGQLYAAQDAAIKRKRVRVEGAIDTETEYTDGATATSGVMVQVSDLLKPYLLRSGSVRLLSRL